MAAISVEEIPTITLLYHLKRLVPAEVDLNTEVTPTPSQSFNDRIGVFRGDITTLEVDAIVNAANKSLLGGGGVDGAIHNAAGDELYDECKTLGGCETGSAKITGAYLLPSKKIIHAVGPVYHYDEAEEAEEKLASCYTTSLKLAVENDCKSIAFSALSTGIYGYPSDKAAPVAIKAVKEFLEGDDGDKLDNIIFTTFVQKDVNAYNKWLPRFFPSIEPTETSEHDEEWEEVHEGGSAENGVPELVEPAVTDTEAPDHLREATEVGISALLKVDGSSALNEIAALRVRENAGEASPGTSLKVLANVYKLDKSTVEVVLSEEEAEATVESSVVVLPDVTKEDPVADGPAQKKQKPNTE